MNRIWLLKALRRLPAIGFIRTPNSVSHEIRHARLDTLKDGGQRAFVLADRYLSFAEVTNQSCKMPDAGARRCCRPPLDGSDRGAAGAAGHGALSGWRHVRRLGIADTSVGVPGNYLQGLSSGNSGLVDQRGFEPLTS